MLNGTKLRKSNSNAIKCSYLQSLGDAVSRLSTFITGETERPAGRETTASPHQRKEPINGLSNKNPGNVYTVHES